MRDSKQYLVYMLKCFDGRVYVGMTSQTLTSRCRARCYDGCPKLKEAIEKLGWDAFEKVVVREGLSKQQAEILEKEMIDKYNSTDLSKGFNVALGGNIKGRHSNETLKKMSDVQKGRVFSNDHLERLRKPKLGGKLRRSVMQFTKEGDLVVIHESVDSAAVSVNAYKESIIRCCNRKQHSCKGYVWEYGGET